MFRVRLFRLDLIVLSLSIAAFIAGGGGFSSARVINVEDFSHGFIWGNTCVILGGEFLVMAPDAIWKSSNGQRWTREPDDSRYTSRWGHSTVQFNDKVWVLAGAVFEEPLATDIWSSDDGVNWELRVERAPFSGRQWHSSVVFHDKMWVIGGFGPEGWMNDVWSSSDGIDWTLEIEQASFPVRQGHTSVVFNDKIWVIGGRGNPQRFNDVWSSVDGINWSLEAPNAAFSARYFHASTVFDERMWVVAGSPVSGSADDVWSSTNGVEWIEETSSAAFGGLLEHIVLPFENELWVIGGGILDWKSPDGINWESPTDKDSVQEAIDAATHGDEIVVPPGFYAENLHMAGKNINLHSIDPTDWEIVNSTILSGGSEGNVITFDGVENETCRVAGFTITQGGRSDVGGERGSGIRGNGTTALIEYNHITANSSTNIFSTITGFGHDFTPGRGGGLRSCNGIIRNNVIDLNFANVGGGLYGCNGLIENNVIARNRAAISLLTSRFGSTQSAIDNFGAGLDSCNGIIQNNTIINNTVRIFRGDPSPFAGGGLTNCQAEIVNNIIWHTEEGLVVEFENSTAPQFCDIKGWTGGGEGNISVDPMLRDVVFEGRIPTRFRRDNDYGLRPDSPCIDAGREIPELTTDIQGRSRGLDWIPEGAGDGSNYDIGAEEFTPGPVTIWIPGGPRPVINGESVDVQWVLQPEAGQTIELSLALGGEVQSEFGAFTTPTGQGMEILITPAMLRDSLEYVIQGRSGLAPSLIGETLPFVIHGTGPSAADPRVWRLYGE